MHRVRDITTNLPLYAAPLTFKLVSTQLLSLFCCLRCCAKMLIPNRFRWFSNLFRKTSFGTRQEKPRKTPKQKPNTKQFTESAHRRAHTHRRQQKRAKLFAHPKIRQQRMPGPNKLSASPSSLFATTTTMVHATPMTTTTKRQKRRAETRRRNGSGADAEVARSSLHSKARPLRSR